MAKIANKQVICDVRFKQVKGQKKIKILLLFAVILGEALLFQNLQRRIRNSL